MRERFLEPELQEWMRCGEKGEPIGFIQYYIQDDLTIGLDRRIGVLKERNQGCGLNPCL